MTYSRSNSAPHAEPLKQCALRRFDGANWEQAAKALHAQRKRLNGT